MQSLQCPTVAPITDEDMSESLGGRTILGPDEHTMHHVRKENAAIREGTRSLYDISLLGYLIARTEEFTHVWEVEGQAIRERRVMAKLAMGRLIVALALLFAQLQVRDVDAWAADGHHITCLIAEV